MKLTIEIRSAYGRSKAYPVDEAAHAFARIARTQTLTKAALLEIEKLGFEIVTTAPAASGWSDVQ